MAYRRWVPVVGVAALACWARTGGAQATDSAAVLHAAWRAAVESRPPHQARVLMISRGAAQPAVQLSERVQAAVAARGVPIITGRRRPGLDTVAVELLAWRSDAPSSARLQLRTAWTWQLDQCRAMSGVDRWYRVSCDSAGCRAAPEGAGVAGDTACDRVPPE